MEKRIEKLVSRGSNGTFRVRAFLNLFLQAEATDFFSRGERHQVLVEGEAPKGMSASMGNFRWKRCLIWKSRLILE